MIAHRGEYWRWRAYSGNVEYVIEVLGPNKDEDRGCWGRMIESITPKMWLKVGEESGFGLPFEEEFDPKWGGGSWTPAYPPLMVECPECGEDFPLEDDYLCEKCLASVYPSLA